MSTAIGPGDVVQVVKPLRCCAAGLDSIFVVTRLAAARADDGALLQVGTSYRFKCQWCSQEGRGRATGAVAEPLVFGHASGFGISPWRLKKYDALKPAEKMRVTAEALAQRQGSLLTPREVKGLASDAWRDYIERNERG